MADRALSSPSKLEFLAAEVARVRSANAAILNRQYLGERGEMAIRSLREAYANDGINLETFERIVGDIVAGRPTRLPAGVHEPRPPVSDKFIRSLRASGISPGTIRAIQRDNERRRQYR